MAKTQTQKNKEYKERHQLTRIELLVSKVTQVRYEEFKKSNTGTTADQLLAMLLDAYQVQQVQADSNTGTTPEPVVDSVVVPAESNTGTTSEPVEVVTGNVSEPAAIAAQLLQAHSTYDAAIAALKADIKTQYPGWSVHNKRHKGTTLEPAQNWYDKVRYKLQKLSTNQ